MLTAIDKDTNQTIFIDDYLDQLDTLRSKNLVDIIFEKEVFVRREHFRAGISVRAHFVTKHQYECELPNNIIFDNEYLKFNQKSQKFSHGESLEHKAGKNHIILWLKDCFEERNIVKIFPEYRIPIKQKNNKYRIIDVAALFPSGAIMAFECQLSNISTEELAERTNDYASEGIDVLWFMGEKARTSSNIAYLREFFGHVYSIDHFIE